MDTLEISGLSISTHIGVHAWEQRILQKVLIDIQMQTDCSIANDNLENTIDYDKVCTRVTAFVESNAFQLIETLAEKVAQLIKNEFSVSQLQLRVCKPNAIKNAKNICIAIER